MRYLIAILLLPLSAMAAPVININAGTPTACVLTPNTTTLLTVDTAGNANATGTLSCTGTTPIPPIPPDPGTCVNGPIGELGTYGYSRMCNGAVRSLNAAMKPVWNNTYAGLMNGPWPGNSGQFGWGLTVTVNQMGFGSFKFNTGSTVSGVSFESNTSYGSAGTASISTLPGDAFSATAICAGQVVRPSTKPGSLGHCQLQLNTDYYLNVSMANPFAPHGTMCEATSCTVGYTVYAYSN